MFDFLKTKNKKDSTDKITTVILSVEIKASRNGRDLIEVLWNPKDSEPEIIEGPLSLQKVFVRGDDLCATAGGNKEMHKYNRKTKEWDEMFPKPINCVVCDSKGEKCEWHKEKQKEQKQ